MLVFWRDARNPVDSPHRSVAFTHWIKQMQPQMAATSALSNEKLYGVFPQHRRKNNIALAFNNDQKLNRALLTKRIPW
jgi:hypothetical protein